MAISAKPATVKKVSISIPSHPSDDGANCGNDGQYERESVQGLLLPSKGSRRADASIKKPVAI